MVREAHREASGSPRVVLFVTCLVGRNASFDRVRRHRPAGSGRTSGRGAAGSDLLRPRWIPATMWAHAPSPNVLSRCWSLRRLEGSATCWTPPQRPVSLDAAHIDRQAVRNVGSSGRS